MLDQSGPRRTHQTDIHDIVQQAQYLSKLPLHQRLALTMAGTVKEFPRESLILSEGSQIEEVYLVLRGMVTVGLYQGVAPSFWLYVSGPGTIVDMFALLEPPVSPVSIYALTDVEMLAIPRAAFVEVMQEESALGYEALQSLCTRLSLITRVALKEFSHGATVPSHN